ERPLELRIPRHHPARDVDLLELYSRVAGRARDLALRPVGLVVPLTRDIDRPELRAHVPPLEPREVSHSRRSLAQIVRVDVHRMDRVFADAPWQVVVTVDHRLRR